MPKWSVEIDQSFNSRQNIGTSILSLTVPGPEIGGSPDAAAEIARDSNDTGAAIRDAQPQEYGFFAAIPSPAVSKELAYAELVHGLDDLKADGLCLFTSYGGKYLGHADFAWIWEEVSKRPNPLVFIHPSTPDGWAPVNKVLPPPVADFAFETTKTALDLILSETISRFPQIKIILSHAGGTLPYIWLRPALLLSSIGLTKKTVEEFQDEASNFYYDTALSGNPLVIDMLLGFAKPGHVLFGSDFPYADEPSSAACTKGLDDTKMSDENREAIMRGNALALIPRLNAYYPQGAKG